MAQFNEYGKIVLNHPRLGAVSMELDVHPGVQFTHHLWSDSNYEGENFIRKWQEENDKIEKAIFVLFHFTYTFPRARKPVAPAVSVNTYTGSVSWNNGLVDEAKAEAFNNEFVSWFKEMVLQHTAELRAHKKAMLRQRVETAVNAVLANLRPIQAMIADQDKAP